MTWIQPTSVATNWTNTTALLLETGDYILQQTGGYILLETLESKWTPPTNTNNSWSVTASHANAWTPPTLPSNSWG